MPQEYYGRPRVLKDPPFQAVVVADAKTRQPKGDPFEEQQLVADVLLPDSTCPQQVALFSPLISPWQPLRAVVAVKRIPRQQVEERLLFAPSEDLRHLRHRHYLPQVYPKLLD